MQIVAIDTMGPLPETEASNSYILVAGDYYTRWMEAYSIPNQEAVTVAQKLVNELFCRFSTPEQLHSDQGSQFESDLIAEVCKILNIRKSRTTPYHPQCDGLIERFNHTLLDMLATTCKDHPFDWEDHIRKVCMAYNTSTQSTTGYTPFFLDLVWLHSNAVPQGKSKKLHHPWKGPWRIVKHVSDAVYRLQGLSGRRRRVIVHFDRLKPCHPNTCWNLTGSHPEIQSSPSESLRSPQPIPSCVGTNLEIYANNPISTRRNPPRTRHPPDRYAAVISH